MEADIVLRVPVGSASLLRFDMSALESRSSIAIGQALVDMTGTLIDLIEGVYAENGPVVVLVDEYDKPILDNRSDVRKADKMREVLHSFCTVLKSCDE